ncbi:MAG: hypothetical protein KBS76_00400, partial [Ruminococcus sp.]|nr:hypothetical protein [Candidatus Apopatosoma intestinale]
MKRIVSIFLALVMVVALFSLVACGEEPVETTGSKTTQGSNQPAESTADTKSSATESTGATESTSGSTEGTTESSGSTDDPGTSGHNSDALDGREKHPDYMDVNFGGATFVFATQLIDDWDCYEITNEATGDDTILTEAINTRNQILQDKYSCLIENKAGLETYKLVENDVSTGQHTVDFVLYQYLNAAKSANYLNIANLDIDLTHDWWDQKFIDCFGIDVDGTKRLYTISGQFNLISFDAIWGMYMNRTLYEQLRATGKITSDIYDMIDGGTWTVDAQIKMMSEAAQDTNGD